MMSNAVNRNLFKGFEVKREGTVISHLQYADDTLCIGATTVTNLWTLKAVLRGFEMVSGLKVNFFKSCFIGVNVSKEFMEMACNFLNCKEGHVPFMYLGLPMRENPKNLLLGNLCSIKFKEGSMLGVIDTLVWEVALCF